jgi:hypothetical protein
MPHLQRLHRFLLLLAVFFSTAVVSPWHEALHLRDLHLADSAAWASSEAAGESSDTAPQEDGAHHVCDWCLASALHAATGPGPAPAWGQLALPATKPHLGAFESPRFNPQRQAFAARAPPVIT